METALGLPEHEKYCVDVLSPGRIEMHDVTHGSHWMQKHMFGVTCPVCFLYNLYWSHPNLKSSASTFCVLDTRECTR
jgi:hypothetical protein